MLQKSPQIQVSVVGKRFVALDSLRGIAALIVVFAHFVDMWLPDDFMVVWPKRQIYLLHLVNPLVAGHAAVILFFVLSGFVLSMPFLHGRKQPYGRFILRRVVRIYMPYYGALLAALVGVSIWHGHPYINLWESNLWPRPLYLNAVLNHLILIGFFNTTEYDGVIWTLVQEMRISLIFPCLYWVVKRISWRWSLALAFLLSCLGAIPQGHIRPAITSLIFFIYYIAFFIIGIVTAVNLSRIEKWWNLQSKYLVGCMLTLGFFLFGYASTLSAILNGHHHIHLHLSPILTTDWFAGCGGLVILLGAVFSPTIKRVLLSHIPHFLGRISYSLYLINLVVLCSITFSPLGHLPLTVQFFMYVALSILSGYLLWWLVERRAIDWSRRV